MRIPHVSRRLLVAALTILVLAALAGLDRYTRHLHEFTALDVDVGDGVHISLTTSGYWRTNEDGSAEHDGRYAIALRVWGTGSDVEVASLTILDPNTGVTETPLSWAEPVRDPSDEALLLFHRPGVPLSFAPKQVTGELLVGTGADQVRYAFQGTIYYSYREESRSRFIAALMSV